MVDRNLTPLHALKQSLPPLPTPAEIRRSEYAMGRRLRWARRNAGYETATAYAPGPLIYLPVPFAASSVAKCG